MSPQGLGKTYRGEPTRFSRIRHLLDNNPLTSREIRTALGLDYNQINFHRMRGVRHVGPPRRQIFYLEGQEDLLPDEYKQYLSE